MEHFDLVILGAGPAGSASAMAARRAGLSVALIDKATFPRAKLCGGLVTGRCAAHLRNVFGLKITPDLFDTQTHFTFYMNGALLADLPDAPPTHLTMRWELDHVLFNKATAAGTHDLSGQRVQTLDLDANTLTLDSGKTLSFRGLIGADGVQSIVAKALLGAAFDARKIGFALEVEAPAQPNPGPIRIDFSAADWGYGWSFPKRGSTTIGLGGLQVQNPDLKTRLAAYRELLGDDSETKIKGHFLPFGGFRNRPGRGNILLAGDAAGFVDPITGEGIGYAIQSGSLAGQAMAEALLGDAPNTALPRYKSVTRPIRTALTCANALRPLIFGSRSQNFFASTFRASRHLKHDYLRLLAGEMEYPQLLLHTARRLPSAGLRHLARQIQRPRPAKGNG